MTGKGDRPRKVDQHKFADNWDKIFRGHMTISEPNASRIRDFFAEEDKYFPLTAQVAGLDPDIAANSAQAPRLDIARPPAPVSTNALVPHTNQHQPASTRLRSP